MVLTNQTYNNQDKYQQTNPTKTSFVASYGREIDRDYSNLKPQLSDNTGRPSVW